MNVYHITQSAVTGYDTFSDAVVIAPDEATARRTHPNGSSAPHPLEDWWDYDDTWPNPSQVTATLIGVAADGSEAGVVCASFNAG